MRGLIILAIVGWLFYSYSNGSLNSWITQFEIADKEISQIRCEDISTIAKGQELQNAFGFSFSVMKISNVRVTRRNSTRLVCSGSAKLSDGRTSTLTMEVYDDSDGDRFYEFRSQ